MNQEGLTTDVGEKSSERGGRTCSPIIVILIVILIVIMILISLLFPNS